MPKKSYDTENIDFDHLDFPINHMLFTYSQFKITDNFNDKEEFKRLKIIFHAILGKNEVEVCSIVKIVKVMIIVRDSFFEGLLQNILYFLVWENNIVC